MSVYEYVYVCVCMSVRVYVCVCVYQWWGIKRGQILFFQMIVYHKAPTFSLS